jgi:two-component system, NtrC family, sensor kinase
MKIHSLQTKFMLLFFVVFFVPYGFLTFFSVSAGREMMRKSTRDHLQNLVEVKEAAIEQWLKERVSDGRSIAASPEIKSLDPKRIQPISFLAKHFEGTYRGIWILNVRGKLISGDPARFSSDREEWLRKAVKDGGFVAGPSIQPGSPKPVITIYTAITDQRHRPVGIVKEVVDLTYIANLIAESKLGETGEFFIVNSRGEFVLHSKPEKLLKKGIASVPYFRHNLPTPTHTEVYKDYTGDEVLGSWKWIQGLGCYLIAEQDVKEAFYQIDLLAKKALTIFIISALLVLGISYWVIGRVTGPIKGLSETVAQFAAGHFGETFSTHRKDEIGNLIAGFNEMSDRLRKAYTELEGKVEASNKELEVAYQMLKQKQEQLVRAEKMAALGQLSAGIAHEIRNPLTTIKIFIQSLEKELELDQALTEDFRIIMREIDRINETITLFLKFARPEEPLFQIVDVGALVKETVNLLAAKLRASGIRLIVSFPDKLPPVEGDPKQLSQAFLNLFLNAVEAMPQGGTLKISSEVTVNPESRDEYLRMIIKDTGGGIPEKDRPYLFDPFFTQKASGTGLGLSIVYSIIQKHNGHIDVESETGKGSSFILSLPVRKEETWKEFSS